MLCPVCHTENLDDAAKCSSCTSSLSFAQEQILGAASEDRRLFESFDAPTMAQSSSAKPAILRGGLNSGASAAAAPSPAKIEPAPDFGSRYRVEGKLGEGGMGSVYKAYDLELDRKVALKVIRQEQMTNAEILQRFKQELLLASRISHKHILRIHDLGEAGGVKFISMAYIEGQNLAEMLWDQKIVPLQRAIDIAKQICQALAAAHQEGVVHRDLKPQNVLIDHAGCVFVSDFGLAKSLEADALAATAMTSVGQVLGTPRYMSPEQVECGEIDGRTDIYSFGLILYEMVTGGMPFQGNSLQLMLGRVQSMPRNPSLLNAKLPAYLAGIIMRCLEKDPARRYQTFSEVLDDLDAERATPPGKTPVRRRLTGQSSKFAVIAVSSVLIIAVALAAVRYLPILRSIRILIGSSAAQVGGKRLAVVPFRVVGTDEKLNEVAVGVVEALNSRLFQLKGVTVASSSAAANANPSAEPEKLGRDLGANLLLLGTLSGGAGDKISFDLRLWDGSQNRLSWTKQISGMTGDVLTLEDEIYNEVVKGLNLTPDVDASVAAHPTENVGAYELYLRATTMMRQAKDPEQVQSAIDLYEQASKADPRFALALAGLAEAQIAMYQRKKDASWANQAVESARRAAQLNPELPEVHFSLGSAYSVIGHTVEAVDQLKQAIQLMPNSDEGYRRLGAVYASSGRVSDAIASYKKAVEINPYYWMNYNRLGVTYQGSGDYENAVTAYRKVVELEPDNGYGYGNLGSNLLLAGKFQDAIQPLQKALQIAPTATRYSNLGIAYYYLQQYDLATSLFEKAVQLAPASWMYAGNLADAYRLSGRKEAAAGTYEKAIVLAKKELVVNPRSAITMGGLGLWYAKKGDVAQGERLIEAARSIDNSSVDLMYFQAQIAALRNDRDSAINALKQAFDKGLRPAIAVAEPDLSTVKQEPRFRQLVQEYSHS
ncbi:MAG TPA: protein kinase [Terriglobales bacterium]|nr:protein kinase [Terriglobales bacterium]